LYRRLLVLLPRAFREESEAELIEVFRDEWRHHERRGVAFWVRMVADLCVTAAAERWPKRELERGRRRGVLQGVGLDVKQAVRRLGREPVQASVSVLALGTGLAATVLVCTLVRGVLLAPLPFVEPDRLVRLIEVDSGGGRFYPSFPNIRDWREHARFLDGIAAADVPQVSTVLHGGGAERALVGAVSRDFFRTLGLRPAAGRFFTESENAPGGPAVTLVSEEFWRSRLGGRPLDELALTIGSDVWTVIGVVPSGFRFLGEPGHWTNAAVWLPLERMELGPRQSHGYHTVARLGAGVTLADGRQQMNALATDLKRRHGEGTQADQVAITLLKEEVVGRVRAPLQLLLVAALFVLVVTCLNLAAAVLARGLPRTRELAVRLSLGARRRDLVRHLQLESVALAVPGALLGIGLTVAGLRALQAMPLSVPRLDEVRMNGTVAVFTLMAALAVTLGATLFPGLALSARSVADRLRTHGATRGREQRRLWSGFVALQIALTLVLLSGTGLLLRSLVRVVQEDVGYRADELLAIDVSLPPTLYDGPERRIAYYTEALSRIRSLAGVQAAGLTRVLPHESTARTGSTFGLHDPSRTVYAGFRLVDPGYFEAVGVRGGRGAALDPALPGPTAAVIDEQLARQLWGDASPVGARLWNAYLADTLTVVGTVASVREWNQTDPVGAVYVDYRAYGDMLSDMHLVVRPANAALARQVHAVLRSLDAMVPVTLEPLSQRIARTFGERRLLLSVAAAFAVVSLVLAVLGVYAITGYAVNRELKAAAIRLVLGARPVRVMRTVMMAGFVPVGTGLIAGLLALWPALRAVRSQLVGVGLLDAPSIVLGVLVLAAGSALAAWVPARRVIRVDPRTILRHD
jgi:predicted permease